MRKRILGWCLALSFAIACFNPASAQESQAYGGCSFYSTDRIQLVSRFNAKWKTWNAAEASLINADYSTIVGAATAATEKPAANLQPTLPAPLKSSGFGEAVAESFEPNWSILAHDAKPVWNFDYEPAVDVETYLIDRLKSNVRPIAVSKVIDLVGGCWKRQTQSSRFSAALSAVDLDRRIFESVGYAQSFVEAKIAQSVSQSDLMTEANSVLSFVESATIGFGAWKKVNLVLPESMDRDAYWHYYDDCDYWDVLINTAIDKSTFDEKTVAPRKSGRFSRPLIGYSIVPIVAPAIVDGFLESDELGQKVSELVRYAVFCATEMGIESGPSMRH